MRIHAAERGVLRPVSDNPFYSACYAQPATRFFRRSENCTRSYATWLEQAVHLSECRAKWRDHFSPWLPPDRTVLNQYPFIPVFFEAAARPGTRLFNGSLPFAGQRTPGMCPAVADLP